MGHCAKAGGKRAQCGIHEALWNPNRPHRRRMDRPRCFPAERDIEQLIDPPEGTFFATDYTPRVIIENGEILAIEFLKGTPSKLPKKKGEYLTDLVKFFQGIGKPSTASADSEEENSYLDKI